jgi:glycosyltransferase involved in cell wall biosynthesis
VAVHNGADYLGDCVDSILAQSYRDFELVISDSASTDGTEELCRSYEARDPRVRYFRSDAYLGITENHEATLREARGELFCWIGADDALHEDYVAACVDAFDADPTLVHVCATAQGIDSLWHRDAPTPLLAGYRDDRLTLLDPSPSARLRCLIHQLRQCNAFMGLYRTDVLRSLLPLEPAPGFDRVLLAQVVLHGRSQQLKRLLYYRRMHSTQTSRHLTEAAAERIFNRPLPKVAYLETVNLFNRQLAAIRQAPLESGERRRCYGVLGARWFPARHRALTKELVRSAGRTRARLFHTSQPAENGSKSSDTLSPSA